MDAATQQQMSEIKPFIRVGHHYQFPYERNEFEYGRFGYCYAFHLVDGGKGSITINGQVYPLQRGDLIFLPPQLMHSFYTDHDHRLATYNLYFELWNEKPRSTEHHLYWHPDDLLPELLTALQENTVLDSMPHLFHLQHHTILMDLFPHIVKQHQQQRVHGDTIAHSLLKAFMLEFIQIAGESWHSDYRMKAIMHRIDKEAHAGSNYTSWLAQSGLQKTRFHSLFKQTAGLSPKAYWSRAVMKQAAAALWESNRSITAIAEDLGYASIHHFTKQFTAYFGVSPSQYRKRKM
ncbi:AraC family transcriptional regulator [Paenibacillus sp. CF384]|uniref:AraC family transcriptional regulator n=1 Tax=Paenibacillus sp. CF384 TaxID=1884382 RepID=UPI00089A5724|nr:AraC family transcriptional regulator [Paenibacillus sp. CF384]SDW42571.1 AraC-type DNA-binding protein [Paenibacillus sp. CF384]